ncbi:hypothetical protein [Chitinophaga sp. MM2321]|uniref:hypothetical protein n=1 Tax=Chitinophaga sp. MM2321 TaxID=3137178 RepID=UPI0032D594B1
MHWPSLENFPKEEYLPLTPEQKELWNKYTSLPFVEFNFEVVCILNITSTKRAIKIYTRFNELGVYYVYPLSRSCKDPIRETNNLIDPELNRLEQGDMELTLHSTTDLLNYLKHLSAGLPIMMCYRLSFIGDDLALNTAFIKELEQAKTSPIEEYTGVLKEWSLALRKYFID